MKSCITSIVLLFMAAFSMPIYGQTRKIDINAQNQTIGQVLDEIKKKSGFEILLNDRHVDLNRRVNVKAENESVDKIIENMFADKSIKCHISGKQLILAKTKKVRKNASKTNNQTDRQNGEQKVSGIVCDQNGEPLIGVTVKERNSQNYAVTDLDGAYSIKVSNAKPTLDFSYVGFVPRSEKRAAGEWGTIQLQEDNKLLDEVVVVGYGTMKKRDLTGSVASVKIDDSTAATVSSASNALAGKVAGLQVTSNSASPGSGSNFLIRGFSSPNSDNRPLIIIDGFPVNPVNDGNISVGKYDSGSSDNLLGSINPNDIASIEVLKDASSTAIYGARAGHGVILITTKKGQKGNVKVSYSGSVSMQKIAKNYDMLDAYGFMTQANRYMKEKWRMDNNIGIYGGIDEDAVTPFVPRYDVEDFTGETTDWIGAVTRTGMQTQHNLSVSGGTDKLRYLVSGNAFIQNGIIKNNDFKRYTLRVNMDQKFNKYLSAGINLTFSRQDHSSIAGGSGQNEESGIIISATQSSPIQPIRDENGNFTLNPDRSYMPNPVSLLDITNKSRRDRFLGSLYVEYKPIEDLTFKATFGIDRNNQKRKVYMPTTTLYGAKDNGHADISQYDQNDYLLEFTGSYNKNFGDDHRLDAVAGYSYQKFNREGFNAGNSNFLTDALLYNSLGMGQYVKPWVGSTAGNDEMASVFGRINYAFKGRYLLTATMRADGCSYFAKGHQWGYFPSVAAAWRFSDEEFLDNTRSWLSNGKLRVSWGQTGNSSIGYQSVSFYSNQDRWGNEFNKGFGGTEYMGLQLTQLGNPNITWETTTEWNFGIDLGFLNNLINFSADYFIREISDLLNWRALPLLQEVTSVADNIGKTRSYGLELVLNTVNINNRDFTWTSDLTFSFSRAKWKERSPSWVGNAYDKYDNWISSFSGYYVADGLVQPGEVVPHMPDALPGQVKIKDISGYVYNDDGTYKVDEHGLPILSGEPDGRINDADRIIVGSSEPGFIMGFNNTLKWRNFDLNLYFYGHFNQWSGGCYKDFWLDNVGNLSMSGNTTTAVKYMWSTDNPDGWRPGFSQAQSSFRLHNTTYFIKKMWFIRCRNITLGYTIPTKGKLSNLRVYADVNNPFMFTNFEGLDPETGDYYPNVRSYNIGVEITF